MRRRRNTDQWEVSLSHKNPLTGEVVRTYHQVTAKAERLAAEFGIPKMCYILGT